MCVYTHMKIKEIWTNVHIFPHCYLILSAQVSSKFSIFFVQETPDAVTDFCLSSRTFTHRSENSLRNH